MESVDRIGVTAQFHGVNDRSYYTPGSEGAGHETWVFAIRFYAWSAYLFSEDSLAGTVNKRLTSHVPQWERIWFITLSTVLLARAVSSFFSTALDGAPLPPLRLLSRERPLPASAPLSEAGRGRSLDRRRNGGRGAPSRAGR